MKTFFRYIISFFRKLFSANGDVGSKRVVGFGSWALFANQVIANTWFKKVIQSELIWATVTIIGACFGLNAWIAVKALASKSQVASDIVKEDASIDNSETAKDVIQGEKPQ